MGLFQGFDASGFPGVAAMACLRDHFDFCGYYLRAPSHPDQGWMGQRQALLDQGWGLAPIYVGQQTQGPGSHIVTADQGDADGYRAARLMADEGFPGGSTVFLDLEEGPSAGGALDPNRALYLAAWYEAVWGQGYQPGVYCSWRLYSAVLGLRPGVRTWVFRVPTTARTHMAAAPPPVPDMTHSNCPEAVVWQRAQNVALDFAGSLVVDLDVSTVADPSAPVPAPAPLGMFADT